MKICKTIITLMSCSISLIGISQTPAGNNQEIQFNNNGVFGASSYLKWDGTNLRFLNLGTYSAKLYFMSETGDDSYIFSENWGSNKNRLVFHTRDDGDDDYAVFRNRHWNDGEKDVFEIHRTWTMANSNFYVMNGNVGIGTKSPSGKLQVEGRTSVGNTGVLNLDWTYENNWGGNSNMWAGYIGFNAYRNNDDAKDNYFGKNQYTSKGAFEGSNHGFRWLYRKVTNNDSNNQHQLFEYMRLDNNGNLGIGTTNPGIWKLAVNGNIRAKEIKVETGWSDFVFENNYNLPTLKEVEQHIKEKGHLQDIPSAEEVSKNGIFLGDMNAKLLQKIEELTLYTIQQQKEIENSRKKVETQNIKIEKIEKENEQLVLLNKKLLELQSRLEKLESGK